MYQANQITVQLNSKTILENLNAHFYSGELCAVLGPNGAGKTSLLKALIGDLPISNGFIHFADRPLHEWTIKDIAKVRGVLPQNSRLDFPFTVRDVIEMGRFPHQTTREYNHQIVKETADLCDCTGLLDRSFLQLSGGEQQRIQIARVLTQVWKHEMETPGFLFLDEPVSSLDISHQYRIMQTLGEIAHQKNIGIVCVIHNLNLAAQSVDRCLILDEGHLVAEGKPTHVFTEETISNVFDVDIWIHEHPEDSNIPFIVPKLENALARKITE